VVWLCLAAGLAAVLAPAAPAGQEPASGPAAREESWQVLDRRPGRGEACLVCGQRIFGEEVVEIRYRGRTFHVAAPMVAEFEADPEAYFRRLQARAALFDESAVEARPVASGWLIVGLYILIGLVAGALCAYLAVGKALSPLPWFFAGLAGNVVALLALLARPAGDASALPAGVPPGLAKVATTREPVRCPVCGASNHPSAAACANCGSALVPTVQAETARV
jgi:hypothetical protein